MDGWIDFHYLNFCNVMDIEDSYKCNTKATVQLKEKCMDKVYKD